MISKQQSECYYQELLRDSCYCHNLEKIARKYTRNTGLSWEDAIQSAHLKVFQAVQGAKFRQGGVEEFSHWAATVAKCEIIDFVRKESLRNCQSLDCNIPGTDISLLDTIPDEFCTLEATERADLIVKAIEAIYQLDQSYPHQKYLKLWQEKINGKTQTQIAAELEVSQGEISKRWEELVGRIAEMLGLLKFEDVKRQQANCKQKTGRDRSTKQW
ncbi:sigma-70 family RNA polymerase sigma factor [Komarekiella sp. 'clone 1']|uniref:Sigma-70 family RNA polymerase sigma factor n=1 Tax=Komarekiella delphini-convector SJRDD-AB1 TaxID=2593771 RepID=A0AA40T383_9NOST|nr:sigma-70 family RNA polymerase sigma factor [Komarekiella delphini-convector]MBD6620108.1 sigma-70 family RNA polymerase sigma factor [Komarekiella delphini-convector SJRDD-AB1]